MNQTKSIGASLSTLLAEYGGGGSKRLSLCMHTELLPAAEQHAFVVVDVVVTDCRLPDDRADLLSCVSLITTTKFVFELGCDGVLSLLFLFKNLSLSSLGNMLEVAPRS